MNSGLVRAFVGTPFPIQKQGLYNLLAVTIANRLQWCAPSERWNLHVNPVLGLLLNDLLQSAFRLWITKKSLFEFVVLFRLGIIPSGGIRQHLVRRLRACTLVHSQDTEPFFDLRVKALGPILGIHLGN